MDNKKMSVWSLLAQQPKDFHQQMLDEADAQVMDNFDLPLAAHQMRTGTQVPYSEEAIKKGYSDWSNKNHLWPLLNYEYEFYKNHSDPELRKNAGEGPYIMKKGK